jgi:uncharacterized membrane protein
MSRARTVIGLAVRIALAVLFVTAGVMHLTDPAFFSPQVPTFVPAADLVIRAVGVPFLVGGVGLLAPARARRWAAGGLILLLLAVWPGNWWGAIQPGSYVSAGGPDCGRLDPGALPARLHRRRLRRQSRRAPARRAGPRPGLCPGSTSRCAPRSTHAGGPTAPSSRPTVRSL